MDGKGAWRDNVFVERFWRTIKYEEVYLHAYDSVAKARQSIGRYLAFYNARRPHTVLDNPPAPTAELTDLGWFAAVAVCFTLFQRSVKQPSY
jgi:putative transposase